MKPARRHDQLKWITEISVTPLLDLVFILLFAFMVALPLVSRTDALLRVPAESASSASAAPVPTETATLAILNGGTVLWNGAETMPVAEIEPLLIEALRTRPALGVILETPRDLPVSSLLGLMEMLKRAGVQSTAIRLTEAP